MMRIALIGSMILCLAAVAWQSGCADPEAGVRATGAASEAAAAGSSADEELAQLLVKLELRTRAVVAGHYGRADEAHQTWLSENRLLPAAVADEVFHEAVPAATGGRAWVKMVVEEPRNEHNRGDSVAVDLMQEIRGGRTSADRWADGAYYYAEPIKTKKGCLLCHGQPRGEPDPFFPQYKKNGWREDQVVGAVVARVASGR